MRARSHPGELGRGDHPADLPTGEREDLARRPDLDRPLGHSGKRGERSECLPVEQHVLPHLVADHDEVVLARRGGDRLLLVASEQPSRRVVRVVEDDRARLRADRGLERRALDPPGRRLERDFADDSASPPDHRRIAVVGRGEEDHLVAGPNCRENRRAQRLGRPARHADVVRIGVRAIMPPVMGRDRLAQRHQAARRRVLVRAMLQRVCRGVEDRVGPAEIGEALAEVHRAMLRRERGHALEHAGRHILVDRVHSGGHSAGMRKPRGRSAAERRLDRRERRGKGILDHHQHSDGKRPGDDGDAGELEGARREAAVLVGPGLLAALDPGRAPRGQLQRLRLAERQDFLHRHAVLGAEAEARAVPPGDAPDDGVGTVPKLDHAAGPRRARRMDQQAARGDVEDAGVAPPGDRAHARRDQHAPPKLARPGFRCGEDGQGHGAALRPPSV